MYEINTRIAQFLDQKLGRWTRLLSWREELADHLQGLYLTKLKGCGDGDRAWDETLYAFGDIDQISEELRQFDRPHAIILRGLLLIGAFVLLGCANSGASFSTFVHFDSMFFVFFPILLLLPFLLFTSWIRLSTLNKYARLSALVGCLVGAWLMLINIHSPDIIGRGLALVLLCSLYATVSLCVSIGYLLGIILMCGAACYSLNYMFTLDILNPIQQIYVQGIFSLENVMRLALISLGGILAGCARWGWFGIIPYLPRVATSVTLVYWISLLANLSDWEAYVNALLLGFLPVFILPFLHYESVVQTSIGLHGIQRHE